MQEIKIKKLMMCLNNKDGYSLILLCDRQNVLIRGKSITDALRIGLLPGTTWMVRGNADNSGAIIAEEMRAER